MYYCIHVSLSLSIYIYYINVITIITIISIINKIWVGAWPPEAQGFDFKTLRSNNEGGIGWEYIFEGTGWFLPGHKLPIASWDASG